MYSPEVQRGMYVVAKNSPSEQNEIYYLMECTRDLAYSWFAGGILLDMRLKGEEGLIVINKTDWEKNTWNIPIKGEE